MELKTNYQYTYFVYPFAIKQKNYKKYVENLIKNKNYQIKFFDSFKDIDMYKYFVPNIKEKMFQDFSFTIEKISKLKKLGKSYTLKVLREQNCLIFDYILENEIQGKVEEKDGIFFTISKIELICFKTGICFLLLKTHLVNTNSFNDLLNFNYKFENINFESKNIKKLENIKIQTDRFSNIDCISKIIENITGQKVESKKLDIDENLFLVYTYSCIEANYWNKDNDFENIENEFVKLAEVSPSNKMINVDYDKLSMVANSSYMKMRVNHKCSALICSATDSNNYTKLSEQYEKEYLYTYIIALHQKYYLKKLNKEFSTKSRKSIRQFIEFTQNIWISEVTQDSFGQKLYKRCKEKFNLEDLFEEAKKKYDIFYKKLKIDNHKGWKITLLILLICCIIMGAANLCYINFNKL